MADGSSDSQKLVFEDGLEINPLANPKGVSLVCHLCQKPARLLCPHCRVIHYCGSEDQDNDWESIHSQVCQLMKSLRAPLSHANSESERKRRKQALQQTRDHICDIALTECRKYLHNGEYYMAFPPSLLALKLLKETHGHSHLQLTPALLLLAQSAIGKSDLRQAEGYLSQAQWIVTQNTSVPPSLQSQLYRNLGLLAQARGDYFTAKKHFAEDVYQSSVAHGPHSIKTVGGLYNLGNVFLKESKPTVAISLYEKVVQIWMDHLKAIVDEIRKILNKPPSILSLPGTSTSLDTVTTLDGAEKVEARQHLQYILSLKDLHSLSSSPLTPWSHYTMALLYTVVQDYPQALTHLGITDSLVYDKEHCNLQTKDLSELITLLMNRDQ